MENSNTEPNVPEPVPTKLEETSAAATAADNNESGEVNEVNELVDNFSRQLNAIFKPEIHFYDSDGTIEYVNYRDETQMPDIMRLIQKDLSEPYSIYTYRYFIHNWPQLCFLVRIFSWTLSIFEPSLTNKRLTFLGYEPE